MPSDTLSGALIISLIIQTIGLDPSGAVQADAKHPTRNRKVVGSNPTSGSKRERYRQRRDGGVGLSLDTACQQGRSQDGELLVVDPPMATGPASS